MEEKKPNNQNKWEKENRERLIVIAPIGTKADIAAKTTESLNSYVLRLIDEDLQRKSRMI